MFASSSKEVLFLLTFFVWLWRAFRWFVRWFWQVVIVGGIVATIIVGLLITGGWAFPPPNQWKVVKLVFEYPLGTVGMLGLVLLLIGLAYSAHRYQLSGSSAGAGLRLQWLVLQRLGWLLPSLAAGSIALFSSLHPPLLLWLLMIGAAGTGLLYGSKGLVEWRDRVILLLGTGVPLTAALIVFVQGWSDVGFANVLGISQTYEFSHVVGGICVSNEGGLLILLSFVPMAMALFVTPIGAIVTPIGIARVLYTDKAGPFIFGCYCLLIGAVGFLAFDFIGGKALQASMCHVALLAR